MDSCEETMKTVYKPPHKRFTGDNGQQQSLLYANTSIGNVINLNKNGTNNNNYNFETNNISKLNNITSNSNSNSTSTFTTLPIITNNNNNFDGNSYNNNINHNNNDVRALNFNNNTINYNGVYGDQQIQNSVQNKLNSNHDDYNKNNMNGNHNINNVNNINMNNHNNHNVNNYFNNYNGENRFSSYVSRNNASQIGTYSNFNTSNNNYHSNTYNPYLKRNYNDGNYNGNNRFNGHQLGEEDLESELFKDDTHEMVQGINFAQYDSIPVEVSGDQVPDAINSFDGSNLSPLLVENVKRSKYTKPTPIQKYAIPCVLHGRDLMACAQTGSGKTAAFLLPIIHQLFQMTNIQRNPRCCLPVAVVLAPTRELAIQIHVQARKFLFQSQFRSVVVYGGADPRKQMRELSQGCEILVATPGRLNDFVERQTIKLENVKFCVLDEADRMLDMGFMPQIQSIVHDMPNKQNRTMLMFSATFPLEIQRLAQEFLNNYIFVAIGRVGSTTSCIKQKLRHVEEHQKLSELTQMLSTCDGLKLIFVEKKRDARAVERELLHTGFNAISIHGDRTQKEREYALQSFRTAAIPILVATDVAARGLDIPNVMWVINFDLPNNIDSYVHRIGRTGRCGNEGNTVAFVNENNKPIFKDLLKLLKETKQEVPQWFADLAYKSHPRDSHFNPYNKKHTQHNFGGRDYRTQRHFNNNYPAKIDNTINKNYNGNMTNMNVGNNTIGANMSHRREFIQMLNVPSSSQTVKIENNLNDSW